MRFLQRHGYTAAMLLVLLVFILLKLPDLSLPYFWDELGVYAPGALRLHDTHLTLMPGGLDPELSRGHPLLCVFLYAGWMRIFGDSVVAAHSLSLLLGCATLTALYACTANLFGRKTGLMTAALCAAQPMFYAMSGVIMPEMPLTLFAVLAAWALLRKKWWVYLAAASLAILTKESGLTILPAACLFLFIESVAAKDFFSLKRWKSFMLAAAPLIVFGLFLILQKRQNGWYFFPLHIGYIDYSFRHLIGALPRVFTDLFTWQGRWLLGLAFAGSCVIAFLRRKQDPLLAKTMLLYSLLIVCGMAFAAVNFFRSRYQLYVLPFVVGGGVLFFRWLAEVSRFAGRVTTAAAVIAAILLGILHMDRKVFQDTSDMSYKHVVLNEQEALRWAQQQPWRDSMVEANFPVFQALEDARNGYISGRPWPHSENFRQHTSYGILWHGEEKVPGKKENPYHVIRSFDRYFSHVTIVQFD